MLEHNNENQSSQPTLDRASRSSHAGHVRTLNSVCGRSEPLQALCLCTRYLGEKTRRSSFLCLIASAHLTDIPQHSTTMDRQSVYTLSLFGEEQSANGDSTNRQTQKELVAFVLEFHLDGNYIYRYAQRENVKGQGQH